MDCIQSENHYTLGFNLHWAFLTETLYVLPSSTPVITYTSFSWFVSISELLTYVPIFSPSFESTCAYLTSYPRKFPYRWDGPSACHFTVMAVELAVDSLTLGGGGAGNKNKCWIIHINAHAVARVLQIKLLFYTGPTGLFMLCARSTQSSDLFRQILNWKEVNFVELFFMSVYLAK